MAGYVKLFGSLLASSLMDEGIQTRWVFVVMLTMADRDGIVEASLPGLAHIARLSIAECEKALQVLAAPDQHSRTKSSEGRRIEAIEGGWRLINYEEYRDKSTAEEKREKDRLRQERRRERMSRSVTPVTLGHAPSRAVTPSGSGSGSEEVQIHARADARDCVPVDEPSAGPEPEKATKRQAERPPDVDPELWRAFLANRAAKKKPLTPRAWALITNRIKLAGVTVTEALTAAVDRGWADWDPSWTAGRGSNGPRRLAVEHLRNAPLGVASCGCDECEKFRQRRASS